MQDRKANNQPLYKGNNTNKASIELMEENINLRHKLIQTNEAYLSLLKQCNLGFVFVDYQPFNKSKTHSLN